MTPRATTAELIRAKRDGAALSEEDIEDLVSATALNLVKDDYKKLRAEIVPPYDVGKLPNKWRKLWKDQPHRDLPFRFGYPDKEKNNHMLVTRPQSAKSRGDK